jgi:hypothetical protein
MYGPLINGGNLPSDYIVGILPITRNVNNQLNIIPPLGHAYDSIFDTGYENGYIGDMLELVEYTVGGAVVASNEYRKILDYRVIPLSETPAYVTTTVDGTEPILTTSISLSSTCDIDNFFTGWIIEFTSTTDTDLSGVQRVVSYYRGYDQTIFFNEPILAETITGGDGVVLKIPVYEIRLESPFSIGELPVLDSNCSFDDNTTFRIRSGCDTPLNEGTLTSGTTSTFVLPASAGTLDYTGNMLWITSDPIVFSNTLASASFVSDGSNQIQGTFVLPAGASIYPDDFFNNMTITLTSGSFSGQSYIITDWDNATLTGTVTPGWTSIIVGTTNPGADTFDITQPNPSQYRRITSYDIATRTGTVFPSFTYTNEQGTTTRYAVSSVDTYEILQFKQDNYHPLDYAESPVSQQQAHCYEIQLISLTLPNRPLKTGTGGTIAFYPYVYVEFKSVTQGTSAYDFNSNNPVVSKNIMFRAPIVYNYNPKESSFITVDGHGMTQILKFKPNDAFRFSVYLPNGELFTTDDDYVSPSEPNPLVQISACFGIKRLGNKCCNKQQDLLSIN